MIYSYEPIFNNESRILILGTVPSIKSLEAGFYYMHPQNRFWKTIALVCERPLPVTINGKRNMLIENHIGLMDIIKCCDRAGSLDSNIKNYEISNINKVIENSKIKKIFCNGMKAYELTVKYYPNLDIVYLPSTSPANNINFDIEKWLDLRKFIKD